MLNPFELAKTSYFSSNDREAQNAICLVSNPEIGGPQGPPTMGSPLQWPSWSGFGVPYRVRPLHARGSTPYGTLYFSCETI